MDCCMQVCTNMHSIIPRGIYSPVCLHDNCKLTRAHFVFSFLSSRERILHSPRCERNQQLRNRRRRRKKEREQLRAAPLEMSFTACPAAKEPCIIEMESVRERTLRARNKPSARLTKCALQSCFSSALGSTSSRHFSPHLKAEREPEKRPSSPVGRPPHTPRRRRRVAPRRQTITESCFVRR